MITMLVIGALMAATGVGYFLIPNIKDRVKGLISDPIRLAKLNGAILTAEEASKALDKKYKEYGKQLNELTKQRGTPEAAFMALYADALEAFKEVQEIFIEGRIVFIKILAPHRDTCRQIATRLNPGFRISRFRNHDIGASSHGA